jgi:hypothetical protein
LELLLALEAGGGTEGVFCSADDGHGRALEDLGFLRGLMVWWWGYVMEVMEGFGFLLVAVGALHDGQLVGLQLEVLFLAFVEAVVNDGFVEQIEGFEGHGLGRKRKWGQGLIVGLYFGRRQLFEYF